MANSGGGHIVVGVEESGHVVVGIDDKELALLKDSKSVNDKLRLFYGDFVTVHLAVHEIKTTDQQANFRVAVLWIPAAKKKIPAQADGAYSQPGPGGKQDIVFRKGDVYVRRGDESTKISLPDELEQGDSSPFVFVSQIPETGFQNPYGFAASATPAMFKGRQAEINTLLNNIASGTHTSIFGLQRIGKTSLVEQVFTEEICKRPNLLRSVKFTKIDFQTTGTEFGTYGEFLTSLFRAVAGAGTSREPADVENQLSLSMKQLVGGKRELLLLFTRLIEGAAERVEGKPVIFLDEFSEFCRVIEANQSRLIKNPGRKFSHPRELLVDVDLMQWFSSLVKSSAIRGRIVFLLAVRPFVAEYDELRHLQLLKLMKPIMLYHLDDAAARQLIVEPSQGQIHFDSDAVDYLIDLTDGHPYLLQFMLKELIDRAMAGSRLVRRSDVRAFENEMISEGPGYDAQFKILDSDYSIDYVLNPSRTKVGNGILSLIAKAGHESKEGWVPVRRVVEQLDTNHKVTPEETSSLLAQLLRAKILEERNFNGEHQIRMSIPLLRKRYIQQNMYLKHFHAGTSRR